MKKRLYAFLMIMICLFLVVGCKKDDKAEGKDKKDEPKTVKVQQAEEKIIQLGSLGFTTDELVTNWNEAQATLEESGAYKLNQINVKNGEFKQDVTDGLILEGIVNEETNEVARLSLIKKETEAANLQASLNKYEDTISAFFLLVAVTNGDEKVKNEDIGKLTNNLGLLRRNDDKIDGSASLNNVTYKAKENERGLVLTAMEKTK